MRDDKFRAGINPSAMKDLIDRLVLKYGSLRAAGEALEMDHQKLSNWRKSSPKQKEFLKNLDKIGKALGIKKEKMWGLVTKDLDSINIDHK